MLYSTLINLREIQMIGVIEAEKAFDKIQCPFMKKKFKK